MTRAPEADPGLLTQNVLVGTLIVLLVTILLAGSALAKVHIDRRDAIIESLSDANVEQQAQLEQLRSDADELALEYAEMSAIYDDMNEHFLPLQQELADTELELESVRDDLAERDRQLSLARQEGSRNQESADVAEYLSWVLLDIILIDEEIQVEYEIVAANVVQMNEHMRNGQYGLADEAYVRASGAMDRIDELFQEREDILAELEDE